MLTLTKNKNYKHETYINMYYNSLKGQVTILS